jgi:hypothetical protein
MSIDFSKEGYVPNSTTVYNNVQIRAGGPDHVVAQMRIEVMSDGGQYSLQTGPITPSDSKGLFYDYKKGVTYKLVIEVNHVTTWTSTKWDVLHTEELADGAFTFVIDGTPEKMVVRKFRK